MNTTPALLPLSPTKRTTLTRKRDRAKTDRAELYAVLDEALICHMGFVPGGSPVVLPTGYGRDGDTMYLHGSSGASSMIAARMGLDVCVTVTLVDGIVYARSVNDHSMNYRSAMIHGTAVPVTDPAAKEHALRVLTSHMAPGSWEHAREPSAKELASVTVLALDLTEASVKTRSGPPTDDPADIADPANHAWAGVLPLHTGFGAPVPSPDLADGIGLPAHVEHRQANAGHAALPG